MLSEEKEKFKKQFIVDERFPNIYMNWEILAYMPLEEAETLFERLKPFLRNTQFLHFLVHNVQPEIISLCLRYFGNNHSDSMFIDERTSAPPCRFVFISVTVFNRLFSGIL